MMRESQEGGQCSDPHRLLFDFREDHLEDLREAALRSGLVDLRARGQVDIEAGLHDL